MGVVEEARHSSPLNHRFYRSIYGYRVLVVQSNARIESDLQLERVVAGIAVPSHSLDFHTRQWSYRTDRIRLLYHIRLLYRIHLSDCTPHHSLRSLGTHYNSDLPLVGHRHHHRRIDRTIRTRCRHHMRVRRHH